MRNMKSITDRLRNAYNTISTILKHLADQNKTYAALISKISNDPGLPVPNPTTSFWQIHPTSKVPLPSSTLPAKADIVILGSGITGAAIAKTITEECTTLGIKKQIVVLDARDVCSGATGRNGGHIKCAPYESYAVALEQGLSADDARKITAFQMKHLDVLVEMCKAEGWDDAECREVETVDVFFDEVVWEKAQRQVVVLNGWEEMRDYVKIWTKDEAIKEFNLSENIYGALSYKAGALWPYRLVMACFSSLGIAVQSNTPVTAITSNGSSFTITTPRGDIDATHVVHATNGHAAHLLPALRGKLFPVRGTMSAQQPGSSLPDLNGTRSWSFINRQGYEYMTQRPGSSSAEIGGEVMTGGGLFQSAGRGLDQLGVSDDSQIEHMTASHLSGVLPIGFGLDNWGEDRGYRIKNIWSGVLGFTPDRMPLVGRLDPLITGREVNDGAEWISAGFNGEGMVNAWLCGVAVALTILERQDVVDEGRCGSGRLPGKVDEWLPIQYYASTKRIRSLDFSQLAMD